MKPERRTIVQPREYHNNIHFWLRKVYYFVANLPENTSVPVVHDEHKKDPPEKDDLDIRIFLKDKLGTGQVPEEITQAEAEEACARLYAMLNEPVDEDVLVHIEDPSCPGGRPRTRFGG
jgi:hypothetical protein